MKNKILIGIALLLVLICSLVFVQAVSQNDVKKVLRKELLYKFEGLPGALTLADTQDFLDFYKTLPAGQENVVMSTPARSGKSMSEIFLTASLGLQEKEEQDFNQTCVPGWKCKDATHRVYQRADCAWDDANAIICEHGCANNQCNAAPQNQSNQSNQTNQTCTAGWKCKTAALRAYQFVNCSWNLSNLQECTYGCSGGVCTPPPENQSILECESNNHCPQGFHCSQNKCAFTNHQQGGVVVAPNSTISTDTVLSGDVSGCPYNRACLNVVGSATLDCNGYRIIMEDDISTGITINGADGATVKNCIVERGGQGIRIYQSTNSNVLHNVVRGGQNTALEFFESTNSVIDDNTAVMSSSRLYPFGVLSTGWTSFSHHNTVSNNRLNHYRMGVQIRYGGNNVIESNEILNSWDSGIYLEGSSNNLVKNNNLHSNQNYGILVNTALCNSPTYPGSSNNRILGNTLFDSRSGIIIGNTTGETASNNTVQGGYTGISVFCSSGALVSGNAVNGTEHTDISVAWDSDGNTISNNQVGNLAVEFNSNQNTISGNTVCGSGLRCFNNSNGNTWTNNICNHASGPCTPAPTCGQACSGVSDQTINLNGDFILTQDLEFSLGGIRVTSNDVTIDCQGHKIISNAPEADTAISIWPGSFNSQPVHNITVKNCVFENFRLGVYGRKSNNCKVIDSTFKNIADGGVTLANSSTVNNNVFINSTGISVKGQNTITHNVLGDKGSIKTQGDANTISYNTIQGGAYEFYGPCLKLNGQNNIVTNNYICCRSKVYDIGCTAGSTATFQDNTCSMTAQDCGDVGCTFCPGADSLCGVIVTKDLTLTDDVVCDGTALTVASDGVTIDCAGHSMRGIISTAYPYSLGTAGIEINGHDNVTVKNCEINRFYAGIRYKNSRNVLVQNNILNNNTYGITITNSSNVHILNNNARNNYWGIDLHELIDTEANNNYACNNHLGYDFVCVGGTNGTITGTGNKAFILLDVYGQVVIGEDCTLSFQQCS